MSRKGRLQDAHVTFGRLPPDASGIHEEQTSGITPVNLLNRRWYSPHHRRQVRSHRFLRADRFHQSIHPVNNFTIAFWSSCHVQPST